MQWVSLFQACAKVVEQQETALQDCQAQELALWGGRVRCGGGVTMGGASAGVGSSWGRAGPSWGGAGAGRAGRQACLVLQEEDDPTGGHQPQLLLKALGVADLPLHTDAGEARAVQVGAVCEPRVSGRLGAAGQKSRGQQRVGQAGARGPQATHTGHKACPQLC